MAYGLWRSNVSSMKTGWLSPSDPLESKMKVSRFYMIGITDHLHSCVQLNHLNDIKGLLWWWKELKLAIRCQRFGYSKFAFTDCKLQISNHMATDIIIIHGEDISLTICQQNLLFSLRLILVEKILVCELRFALANRKLPSRLSQVTMHNWMD